MPTSVLLAILAAAGLLALAPALVRRHDVTERQVAERAQSTARVLSRERRQRTVPGHRPVNPSATATPQRTATVRRGAGGVPARPVRSGAGGVPARPVRSVARRVRRRESPAVYRRRRVLAALLLLNLVELTGVLAVGPGFWVGFAVTATVLVGYLMHLRSIAVADQRRRRVRARRAAVLAAEQAEVRLAQQRRAAARRETARRMAEQRESLRRAAVNGSVPARLTYRGDPSRRSRAG